MGALYKNTTFTLEQLVKYYNSKKEEALKTFSFYTSPLCNGKHYVNVFDTIDDFSKTDYFWYAVNKKDKVVMITEPGSIRATSVRYLLDYDTFEKLRSENYDFNAAQMVENGDFCIPYTSKMCMTTFDSEAKSHLIAPICFYTYYMLSALDRPWLIPENIETPELTECKTVNVYKKMFVKKTGKNILEEFFDLHDTNDVKICGESYILQDPAYFNMNSTFEDMEYGVVINKSKFSIVRNKSTLRLKFSANYELTQYMSEITVGRLINDCVYSKVKENLEKYGVLKKAKAIIDSLTVKAVPFCMDVDYSSYGNKVVFINIKKTNLYELTSTDPDTIKCITDILSKPSFSVNSWINESTGAVLRTTLISKEGLLYLTEPNKTLKVKDGALVIMSGRCSISVADKKSVLAILEFLLENKKIDQEEHDRLGCEYVLLA